VNEKAKKKLLKWILKDYEEEKELEKQREAYQKAKQQEEEDKASAWLYGQYGHVQQEDREKRLRELEIELKTRQLEALEQFKGKSSQQDEELDKLILEARRKLEMIKKGGEGE